MKRVKLAVEEDPEGEEDEAVVVVGFGSYRHVDSVCSSVGRGYTDSRADTLIKMNELVTLAGGAGVAASGPPTEMVFGDWYPALRVGGLKAGKTAKAMLLGIPVLVGRKRDGTVFALRDLCPHRGIPLSAGWFDGETVQCKYHGWRFEPCSGQCREIPSLTSHDSLDPTKIYATAYPCVERDGYAWVYVPAAGGGQGDGRVAGGAGAA